MVPANAGNLLTQAVLEAQKNGGNFECMCHIKSVI